MCSNHFIHTLLLISVQLIDSLVLSNFSLLNRLHSTFPASFRLLLSVIKALACWMSGGKSWLQRTCSDRRNWQSQKSRIIQLISIHLRHSRSLSVLKTKTRYLIC